MPDINTARQAADMRRRILPREDYRQDPTPSVRVPLDDVPKAHAKRLTAADKGLDTATRIRLDVGDQVLDAETDITEERAWRARQSAMASRIGSGDTSANVRDILPTYDPAQTLATYETLLYAMKAARAAEAAAVKEYDEAVREILPLIHDDAVAKMHEDAAHALEAVEVARQATVRALSSRQIAHGLRTVEAEDLLAKAGHTATGPSHARRTLADLARTVVAACFATALNVAETVTSLDALSGVLQAVACEDPSAPWPASLGSTMPGVAAAFGVQPEAPTPLMTREEFVALCRRADASGQMRPPMPHHLVR